MEGKEEATPLVQGNSLQQQVRTNLRDFVRAIRPIRWFCVATFWLALFVVISLLLVESLDLSWVGDEVFRVGTIKGLVASFLCLVGTIMKIYVTKRVLRHQLARYLEAYEVLAHGSPSVVNQRDRELIKSVEVAFKGALAIEWKYSFLAELFVSILFMIVCILFLK